VLLHTLETPPSYRQLKKGIGAMLQQSDSLGRTG
jgi:hypothetical protein